MKNNKVNKDLILGYVNSGELYFLLLLSWKEIKFLSYGMDDTLDKILF